MLSAGCANLDIDASIYTGPLPVSSEDAIQLVTEIKAGSEGVFNQEYEAVRSQLIAPAKEVIDKQHYEAGIIRCEKIASTTLKDGASVSSVGEDAICPINLDPSITAYDTSSLSATEKARFDKASKRYAKAWVIKKWRPLEPLFQREIDSRIKLSFEQVVKGLEQLEEAVYSANTQKPSSYDESGGTAFSGIPANDYQQLLVAKDLYDLKYESLESKLAEMYKIQIENSADEQKAITKLKELSPDRVVGISSGDMVKGRVIGSPIFNKNIRALSKNSSYWKPFNSNSFTAIGGDAQFVAVRKGLVEYRQKSLDFDPTPAVGAGSALTSAGLKVAAALASGQIPVLPSDGSEPISSEQVINEVEIKTNNELLARRKQAKALYLMTLSGILSDLEAGTIDDSMAQKRLSSATNYLIISLEIPKGGE